MMDMDGNMDGFEMLDTDEEGARDALRSMIRGGIDIVSEDEGYLDMVEEYHLARRDRAGALLEDWMMGVTSGDDADRAHAEIVAEDGRLFEELVWEVVRERFKDRIDEIRVEAWRKGMNGMSLPDRF